MINYLIVTFKVRATACLGQEKPKIRTDYELAMSGENLFAPNQELKRVQKKASL